MKHPTSPCTARPLEDAEPDLWRTPSQTPGGLPVSGPPSLTGARLEVKSGGDQPMSDGLTTDVVCKDRSRDLTASVSDLEQFRTCAREQYDLLLHQMEFRSLRAALMHYHEAAGYNRKCYYVEVAAAVIGAASLSGLGAVLVKWTLSAPAASSGTTKAAATATKAGLLGLLGVAVSALLEFVGKGSSDLVPTFSKRGEAHKMAAAGWQRLTRVARSRRIQLHHPSADVSDYQRWYEELVLLRQEVSEVAMVATTTHRSFNDPARVYAYAKRRQSMFLRYVELCKSDVSVQDMHDDDD